MNVETISMDPKEAAVAFRDYRSAVKLATDQRRKREDEQVMRAYKAASKGQQVLDLHEVMKTAGLNAAAAGTASAGRRRSQPAPSFHGANHTSPSDPTG